MNKWAQRGMRASMRTKAEKNTKTEAEAAWKTKTERERERELLQS